MFPKSRLFWIFWLKAVPSALRYYSVNGSFIVAERQQGKLGFWWISHRTGIQKALLLSDQSEPSVHVTWSELTNERPGIQSSLLSVWAAAEFAVNTGLLWIFHVGTGLGSTPGLNLNNEHNKFIINRLLQTNLVAQYKESKERGSTLEPFQGYNQLLEIFHVGKGLGSTPGLNLNNQHFHMRAKITPFWYCSSVQGEG